MKNPASLTSLGVRRYQYPAGAPVYNNPAGGASVFRAPQRVGNPFGNPAGGASVFRAPQRVGNPGRCPPGTTWTEDLGCTEIPSGRPKPKPKRPSGRPKPKCPPGQFYSEDLGCVSRVGGVKANPPRCKPGQFYSEDLGCVSPGTNVQAKPKCPPGQFYSEDLGCVSPPPPIPSRARWTVGNPSMASAFMPPRHVQPRVNPAASLFSMPRHVASPMVGNPPRGGRRGGRVPGGGPGPGGRNWRPGHRRRWGGWGGGWGGWGGWWGIPVAAAVPCPWDYPNCPWGYNPYGYANPYVW